MAAGNMAEALPNLLFLAQRNDNPCGANRIDLWLVAAVAVVQSN
jgi:hypothetical protein